MHKLSVIGAAVALAVVSMGAIAKAVGKINLNLSWNDADSGCTDLVSTDRDGLCEAVVFAGIERLLSQRSFPRA